MGKPEQSDASHLADEKVAGWHPGEQHFDDSAGLLFDDASEDQIPIGEDGREQQDAHQRGGCLVVGVAARHQAELDVLDCYGGDEDQQFLGTNASGRRPLLDGDQLDGAGDHGAHSFVDFAAPLQPSSVNDEHVDVVVADCLLGADDVVVLVDAHRHTDCVALVGQRAWQRGWNRASEADVGGRRTGFEQCRHDDCGDDDEEHDHQPGTEAAGPAALAHLPNGDEPDLLQADHAATARWNSSDNVGG